MFNMLFNVISQHHDDALHAVSSFLKRNGAKIIDLREADVVRDDDDSKVSEAYIFCCQETLMDYLRIKKHGHYEEIIYEGRRTLM